MLNIQRVLLPAPSTQMIQMTICLRADSRKNRGMNKKQLNGRREHLHAVLPSLLLLVRRFCFFPPLLIVCAAKCSRCQLPAEEIHSFAATFDYLRQLKPLLIKLKKQK